MYKNIILITFLTGCSFDSAVETDEYMQEALELQDALVADSSNNEPVTATITFENPAPVATALSITDRYELDVVGTYVYAVHDDGVVGTMITTVPPDELQTEIDQILGNERASLLGVGTLVVDMPLRNVKPLQEQAEIHLVDVSGEFAPDTDQLRHPPSRAWKILGRKGYVDDE